MTWAFFDAMNIILGGNAMAEPEYVAAAGVTNMYKQKRRSSEDQSKTKKKRKSTPVSRQLEIMRSNAKARNKMARTMSALLKLTAAKMGQTLDLDQSSESGSQSSSQE